MVYCHVFINLTQFNDLFKSQNYLFSNAIPVIRQCVPGGSPSIESTMVRFIRDILFIFLSLNFDPEYSQNNNNHFFPITLDVTVYVDFDTRTMIIENDFYRSPPSSIAFYFYQTNNHNFICLVAPQRPPKIFTNQQDKNRQFNIIDELFQATCTSPNGRPAAKLAWFLNDDPITEGVSAPRIDQSLSDHNTTLYTVSIALNRNIKASDDNKFLICRAIHEADAVREDRIQFRVQCKF